VPDLAPAISPFDPGYDPVTLESHLEQSAHLISILKVSMACWMVAGERATRKKMASAKRLGVSTTTGGGPFEVAVAQGRLDAYLDLCAGLGFDRIECGEGFTDMTLEPAAVVAKARERGLDVQFELGKKHTGAFSSDEVEKLIEQGRAWLDAGAVELVVEARESAQGVGTFDEQGNLNGAVADQFADAALPGELDQPVHQHIADAAALPVAAHGDGIFGGEPVGMVSGVETTHPDKGTEMFLYELSVAEPYRGRGIATALVTALAELARRVGCYGMWVLTDDTNAPALGAYEAAGGVRETAPRMLTWTFSATGG
jgi:phosphosulfolactate synthase (CoM biosynthesis protein A)